VQRAQATRGGAADSSAVLRAVVVVAGGGVIGDFKGTCSTTGEKVAFG